MTPSPSLFQALLRPAILQILRATGFHSTRPAVLDSLTDLAASYLLLLCRTTAVHTASHVDDPVPLPFSAALASDGAPYILNDDGLRIYRGGGGGGAPDPPTLTDVRLALEDVGAMRPVDRHQANVERWVRRRNERRRAREAKERLEEAEEYRTEEAAREAVAVSRGWEGQGGGGAGQHNAESGDGTMVMEGVEGADVDVDVDGDRDCDRVHAFFADIEASSPPEEQPPSEATTTTDVSTGDESDNGSQMLDEDLRCLETFLAWFSSPRMKQIRDLTAMDDEPGRTDYLNALKMKHSKTSEDSKYNGTILGKANDDTGEVLVEGGDVFSIHTWMEKMRNKRGEGSPSTMPSAPSSNDDGEGEEEEEEEEDSRPPSSGLSSLGDRIDEEEMDLS